MITSDLRQKLLKRVDGGQDYLVAAKIYAEMTGREINPRYIYKFIAGHRKVTGKKPTAHQPLNMFEALVEAVKRREDAEMKAKANANAKANELLERLAA